MGMLMSKLIAIREIADKLGITYGRTRRIISNLDLPTEYMYSGKAGPPVRAISQAHLDKIRAEYERTTLRQSINITHDMAIAALEEAKAIGLSLPQIAEKIGVDPSLLYHVLHGNRRMTVETYEKIATWQKERAENE
jgi:hypothetical protein